jgi:hypothetical protein
VFSFLLGSIVRHRLLLLVVYLSQHATVGLRTVRSNTDRFHDARLESNILFYQWLVKNLLDFIFRKITTSELSLVDNLRLVGPPKRKKSTRKYAVDTSQKWLISSMK